MAAEARVQGQVQGGDAQRLHKSVPINREQMSVKQRIQATFDSQQYFIPKKSDTKRFSPGITLQVPFLYCFFFLLRNTNYLVGFSG